MAPPNPAGGLHPSANLVRGHQSPAFSPETGRKYMKSARRTSTAMTFQIEALHERIAPAHLGPGALHAAMVHHRAALLARLEARSHSNAPHAGNAARHRLASSQAPAALRAPHGVRIAPAAQPGASRTTGFGSLTAATAPAGSPGLAGLPTSSPTPIHTIITGSTPVVTTSGLPTSLPANAGDILNTIYQEYQKFESGGGTGTFTSLWSPYVTIQGSKVGVEGHGNGSGDFDFLLSAPRELGVQGTATDAGNQTGGGPLALQQPPA